MLTNNHSGVEAINKGLKIRDGLVEPGTDSFIRASVWFSASIESEYREGIEILCNSWERIRGKDNVLFVLLQRKFTDWFEWSIQIPNDFLNRLYKNEHNEKVLMEIYCYFSFYSYQFDAAYSLLTTSPRSGSLFEVLYNSLRDIIENEFNYVSGKLKPQYFIRYAAFSDIISHLYSLRSFIRQVDIFRKGAMENLEQSSEHYISFNKSFNVMYDQLSKIIGEMV